MYYTAVGRSPKHTAKGAPLDEGHAVRPVITLPEEGARALVPGGGRMISRRTYAPEKPGLKARFIASRGACLHSPCADGTVRDV
jgi:hypothetical protein